MHHIDPGPGHTLSPVGNGLGQRPTTAGGPKGQLFVATDPEQAQALGCEAYYPQRLKVLEPTRHFEMHVRTSTLNSLTLGDLTYNAAVEIDCAELRTAYHVNVPLSGAIDSEVSRISVQATPQRATLYRPTGRTLLRRWYGSSRALTLKIERTALETHLQSLLGRSWTGTIDFGASLDVSSGLGASWWTMVRHLDEQLSSPEGASNLARFPLVAHHLEYGVVVGLLLAADHSFQGELQEPGTALRPRTVQRAIDAIEEGPERALTVAELARIAGCSVRRLQESFRDHVGSSPMAYLRRVRLDRVRDALIEADPAASSVSDIAYTWGFANLGRFSLDYKRRFGVSPSTTLRA